MEKEILSKLYQKYSKEIYLYLFSLSNNAEISEDLMQETFLKALLSLSEHHTNMRAWLYTVARNIYYNYRKKENRIVSMQEIQELLSDEKSEEMLAIYLKEERQRFLYKALQCIGEQKREVLILHYYGGMSQKEIASLLHMSPENVRVLAYRGKKELKKYLEEKGYEIS